MFVTAYKSDEGNKQESMEWSNIQKGQGKMDRAAKREYRIIITAQLAPESAALCAFQSVSAHALTGLSWT
jgi:hypothetical protein